MTNRWWVLGGAALVLGACGGNVDTSVDSEPAGGQGGTGASGGKTGASGRGGTGGASGRGGAAGRGGVSGVGGGAGVGGVAGVGGTAGSFGAGGAAGAGGGFPGTRTVTLRTDDFVIPPGGEAFKCQTFRNPFGTSVDVVRTESHMPKGSHHMIAFFESNATDGSVYDCSGLEFGERVHAAQTPDYTRQYPTDVGLRMNANEGLRFNMHWLNTTGQPLDAHVELTITAAAAGTAKYAAGFLFMNNMGINIPPKSRGTATKTCSMVPNVKIMDLGSHMHMWATHFIARTGSGKVIYEGTEWDHPVPALFDPGLELGTDTEITWTCTYNNTSDSTLTFGESAATNEMCILGGTFYPAPAGSRSHSCL